MLIVSQDKTELINFDNIVRLSVDVNMNGQFLIEAHNFSDDFETVIGLYETEERAKEVLKEIIKKYEMIQYGKYFKSPMVDLNKDNGGFYYKMPEE